MFAQPLYTVYQPIPVVYYNDCDSQLLMDAFNHFWLCDLVPQIQPIAPKIENIESVPVKQARTIHAFNFSDKLYKLNCKLSTHFGSNMPFIEGKKKSQACKTKGISKRRTRFTGVTRNSVNYQTLIVVNGKKVYVDSFSDELLAAITFDFYSILLRGEKATTNFTYSAEKVKEMLDHFIANDQKFMPQAFV